MQLFCDLNIHQAIQPLKQPSDVATSFVLFRTITNPPKKCIFPTIAKLREACFDPGNVMNGTRLGNDYKLGSTVTFSCEAGYLLQGHSTLTCVMGNSKRPEWDRARPSCQGEATDTQHTHTPTPPPPPTTAPPPSLLAGSLTSVYPTPTVACCRRGDVNSSGQFSY